MNEHHTSHQEQQRIEIPDHEGVQPLGQSLLDAAAILIKWRRLIVWLVLVTTLSTIILTFLMPKWYKSTATVFPAEQTDLISGLADIGSIVKSFSGNKKLGSLGGPSELDRYQAILKSSTVKDSMIQKFDLIAVYEATDASNKMERTRNALEGNSVFEMEDEGDLSISVFDRSPQRAADMANYYVEILNTINSELRVQNARGNKMFVEQRYTKNLDDIRKAEEAFKTFQLKYGVIAMPEQIEASIKAGAEVHAKLASKEIELGVLKRTLGEEHPNVQAAQIEVDEIKRKISDMNTGPAVTSGEMNIFVPFKKTPELGMQYIRLYRDVEIQYKILQFITPLYEQAKVEEQRNTPSVIVLDRALPAERKTKPKVSLYALIALVVSTLLALLGVFCIEGVARIRKLNPDRFDMLVKTAWSDRFGLLRKRKKTTT